MSLDHRNDEHLRCYGNEWRSINCRSQLAQPPDRITIARLVNFPLVALGQRSSVDAAAPDNDFDGEKKLTAYGSKPEKRKCRGLSEGLVFFLAFALKR